ncbi:MAG: hypothetical protein IFK94_12315 [Acidobacteria bacterium]|uniref:Bacterial type II secretion system protein E domain-containing protein n=1 Tax=Candidatus Polarisedimenticola svalbardensis TaxID=2886004 RepID=A0A8J6Y1V0_9BACT|nr:hypothetical protein [Candidatus Polarisedimenticola svalbardensis]
MSQLDPMLRALAERGALELLLKDGARPVFRFDIGDRPVSQTVLERAQIIKLMSELADDNYGTMIADGGPVRFTYSTPDGAAFECVVRAEEGMLGARLVPCGGGKAAEVTPPPVLQPSAPIPVGPELPSELAPESGDPMPASPIPPRRTGVPEIEALLRQQVETDASDLHLAAGERPMFRIHGDMLPAEGREVCSPEETARLLFSIIPPRNKKEFEETNDTSFPQTVRARSGPCCPSRSRG